MTLVLCRLSAHEDLVEGIEALARHHGLSHAIVRSGPGSLMSACVQAGGGPIEVAGPGTEILSLVGEVTPGGTALFGTVGDPDGRVFAGRFVPGRNPVCITLEFALEAFEATLRPPER